jgi:hypothetical protein
MRFLLSIYGNDEVWGSLGDAERDQLIQATDAHNAALVASGELLSAFGTADPSMVRKVTLASDGARVVSDGPYIETKEYLGSFYIVDCEDVDRALEIAAAMPSAAFRQIEVWPLMHGGTAEDL